MDGASLSLRDKLKARKLEQIYTEMTELASDSFDPH